MNLTFCDVVSVRKREEMIKPGNNFLELVPAHKIKKEDKSRCASLFPQIVQLGMAVALAQAFGHRRS
jgi:hypothetical protein